MKLEWQWCSFYHENSRKQATLEKKNSGNALKRKIHYQYAKTQIVRGNKMTSYGNKEYKKPVTQCDDTHAPKSCNFLNCMSKKFRFKHLYRPFKNSEQVTK